MLSWQDIEESRRKAGLSRAKMCRLAGISESTVTKGLKNGTRPTSVIESALRKVLAAAEGEVAA